MLQGYRNIVFDGFFRHHSPVYGLMGTIQNADGFSPEQFAVRLILCAELPLNQAVIDFANRWGCGGNVICGS